MIGYEEDSRSRVYRVYDEGTKQVSITRDVVFDETTTKETQTTTLQGSDQGLSEGSFEIQEKTNGNKGEKEEGESPSEEEDEVSTGQPLPPIDPNEESPEPSCYDYDTIVVRPPQSRRPPRDSPQRERFPPSAGAALMALAEEPQTLQEALACHEGPSWRKAWESELASLEKNGTWVVERAPQDRNIVGCRWLFRKKEDGRFKVRLVAKGYSQEPGIDFQETFAPVATFTTLRVLLALVAENDWELHSMDVKTAFLNGVLEEEIYMECPEGVLEEPDGDRVCRLIKAIYGLRQSPRAWYEKIHAFFMNHNFTRSTQDYSLYINYSRQLLVLVYVDDLVLAAAEVKDIDWIKDSLTKAFEMTDLGELSTFLGLEISRNRSQRLLTLHQARYISKILHRHSMQDARPSPTPLTPNTQLRSATEVNTMGEETESKAISLDIYQSAVGSLMYAMLGTRPDIAYAVGCVSQFNHSPLWEHWIAVKRIFRYLAGTKDLRLQFGTSNTSGGYSDADWGSGQDRKSIGGFVVLLNGGAISWSSKKQTSIALSTTEAEYMAMTQVSKEIIWLRVLLRQLGALGHIRQISQLYGDNQGALGLARNPEYHARTKHIDIQYHYVRDLVMSEKVYLEYCPSSEMIADIMTKSLPQVTHEKHTKAMGMIDKEGKRYGTHREGGC